MIRTLLYCLIFFSSTVYATIPEKVLICGVCKDVESRLSGTIEIMEHIGSLFDDYRIIVYENNSSDKTPTLLSQWAKKNQRVSIQSEYLSRESLNTIVVNADKKNGLFRPELIARARNIVLDQAFSDDYENFNYLIWMDMDFVLPPAYEGIVEVFHTDREWDAVLAYGIDPPGTYWDWYAFRDDVYPLGSELLGDQWWYMEKNFSLTINDDWYPVTSAFGGCGIYKKSSIIGCQYSALVNEDLEIVARDIIQSGKRNGHPQIIKYLRGLEKIEELIMLNSPVAGLPQYYNPEYGFVLSNHPEAIIWRMSSFFYQYPTVCEHTIFHASMIVRGHDKIFINPRLIFRYGG